MLITVNGEAREVQAALTVCQLLQQLDITTSKLAVEINGTIVPRSQHQTVRLEERDVVEIVQAIGGG